MCVSETRLGLSTSSSLFLDVSQSETSSLVISLENKKEIGSLLIKSKNAGIKAQRVCVVFVLFPTYKGEGSVSVTLALSSGQHTSRATRRLYVLAVL